MTGSGRNTKTSRVDVIIPVYQPGAEFCELLRRLALQSLRPEKVIIINTDERFWKDEYAENFENTETVHITKKEFTHGHSRNLGASRSDADIIVFMTQDALPADRDLIRNLIRPVAEGAAAVSSARQIAKKDADPIERITREFNYPDKSSIKSAADIEKLGIKAFFSSNVCAAYDKRIFDQLGGFHDELMFNEDMVFAAEALKAGYKSAYTAGARVYHSHNYTGREQYRRNKEIGRSQKQFDEIFGNISSEGEGIKLVKTTAKRLLKENPLYIFKLIWISGCKYLGYRAGKKAMSS